jgi:poly-gamma-glutamate capsule biosynthesis protein CapA/YwtB (metallophosphatase superfamily)
MPGFHFMAPLFLAAVLHVFQSAPCRAEDREKEERAVRLLFVGDTSSGENYQSAIEARGGVSILEAEGYDYSLGGVRALMKSSHFVIANLETPLTEMTASPRGNWKKYIHRSDPEEAPTVLRKHGVRAVSLANNHTLDFGGEGLKETLKALENHDIAGFGAGMNALEAAKPLGLTLFPGEQPLRLKVLAGCWYGDRISARNCAPAGGNRPGVNAWTGESAARQVRALRQSDEGAVIICFPHWGENYRWKSAGQSQVGRMMIDAGADLVIGHGAHLLQDIEKYKGRWIIYNLGNFVFNSPGRYGKEKADPFSLAARLEAVKKNGEVRLDLRLYPLFTDNRVTRYQTRPANEAEAEAVREVIVTRSPDPGRLRGELRAGKDDVGYYLELGIGTVSAVQAAGNAGEGMQR